MSGVRQAEAGMEAAQADVTLAQSSFERTDDLYQTGSATQPQEDAAKAALDSAKSKFDAAQGARDAAQSRVAETEAQISTSQARITDAQSGITASEAAVTEAGAAIHAAQAQVVQAQSAAAAQQVPLAETVLRSPLTGVVLARRVEVGSLVGPGSPAFSIADLSRLDVVFGIPETEAGRLRVGQRVTLTLGAADTVPVTGTITELAPTADPATRVFDVQVTVPNADGTAKSGMVATLTLGSAAPDTNALVAPLSAIVQSRSHPSGYAVVVVENENGRRVARYRDVQIGPSHGDTIVVQGLARGVLVVASAPSLLYDGEPVRIADAGGGG
jgi:RND family efflux transporter MFP subunit